MILDILTFPAKSLREKSSEVKEVSPEIKQLIVDMKDTLLDIKGYGLAAPQVGSNIRLFIADESAGRNGVEHMRAYINPVFISGDGEILTEEGCLSVPDEFAAVKRHLNVKYKVINEDGKEEIIEATEQLARIFQHETDHLDGVLFIDHLPPFKRDTMKKHIKRRIKEGEYEVIEKQSKKK